MSKPMQGFAPAGRTVAVIGAGVVGLTTALQLLQQGYQVMVFERETVGAGASSGNAGHFASEQVFPLAHASLLWSVPKFLLNPLGPLAIRPRALWSERRFFWHYLQSMWPAKWRYNHQILRSLCQQAIDAWQQLLASEALSQLLVQQGNLLVFEGQTAMQQALKAKQHYQAGGVDVELWSAADVQQYCAGIHQSVQCALYFPGTGHCVSPLQLCQALQQAIERRGGVFHVAEVQQLQPSDHGITVQAKSNCWQVDDVVLCTGVHANTLLEPLGLWVPMTAERGYHLEIKALAMPPIAVASFNRHMIMTPMQTGLRLAGTVEFAGIDALPNWQRAQSLRRHGEALWPSLREYGEVSMWSGQRPTCADSLPVVGASGVPRLWLNFGHQHLGLTLAAVTSRWLVDAMQGCAKVNSLDALSIRRFA